MKIRKEKKEHIRVLVVLDSSGSMEGIKRSVISGFNEYIDTLKKDTKKTYAIDLVTFSDRPTTVYSNVAIQDVAMLDEFQPNGTTALYDAVCSTVIEAKKEEGTKIVVIITDGAENSSQKYTQKDLKEYIQTLSATNQWTFVYLGANQDAWGHAQTWGMRQENVASYQASDAGARSVFSNLAGATMSYNNATSKNVLFNAEQKNNIQNAV